MKCLIPLDGDFVGHYSANTTQIAYAHFDVQAARIFNWLVLSAPSFEQQEAINWIVLRSPQRLITRSLEDGWEKLLLGRGISVEYVSESVNALRLVHSIIAGEWMPEEYDYRYSSADLLDQTQGATTFNR